MKSLLALIVLIAVGVTGYLYWQKASYNGSKAANEPTVEEIKRGNIEDKISASGKVEAKGGLVPVTTEINGKIVKVSPNVEVGKKLSQGELLIQLDDATEQFRVKFAEAAVKTQKAELKRAEANIEATEAKKNAAEKRLEIARDQLEKAEKDPGTVASVPGASLKEKRQAFEQNEAESKAVYALIKEAEGSRDKALEAVNQANAGLDLAKRGFEQTRITAPSSGVILKISEFVREGQLITPTMGALITIAPNPDQWEVKAQISEQDIGKIHNKLAANQDIPVRFKTEAYSAEKQIQFTGKVLNVAPLPTVSQRSSLGGGQEALLLAALSGGGGSASSGPANYTVTISVDPIPENIRKTHPLLVGYTATDLQIVINHYKDVVCVPSAALSFTPEGMSDAQQKELKQNEEAGLSAIWFWTNGSYESKYIRAGASDDGRTQVLEVKGGRPEDLVGKPVVTEGPKKPETGGGLFGNDKLKIKLPG